MHRDRRGMTLIELLLATALLGMIVLGSHAMIDVVMTSDDRMAVRARAAEEQGVGHRMLFDLMSRAHSITDSSENFYGDARAVRLIGFCETPHGWRELCRASLQMRYEQGASVVEAWLSADQRIHLIRVSGASRFIYLDGSSLSGRWIEAWGSSIDLPAAVGVIRDRDTLLVPVGVFR